MKVKGVGSESHVIKRASHVLILILLLIPDNQQITIKIRSKIKNTNELHCAVCTKAMMELDPDRTSKLLTNELRSPNGHRVRASLAGMGLIASPVFTGAIVDFKDSPRAGEAGNKYPRNTNFDDGTSGGYYDYALHRCRGVHRWELHNDPDGRVSIRKPGPEEQ